MTATTDTEARRAAVGEGRDAAGASGAAGRESARSVAGSASRAAVGGACAPGVAARASWGAASAALPADALYGRLLASAAQHLDGAGPAPRARIRLADGRLEPLPLDRWLAPADDADLEVLAEVEGPVLDLGCGPGRHLAALRVLGKRGLGVDLSPVAVALARGRGADAISGSLWAPVPGTWRTVLLLDGNIGIGGAPGALLKRAGELLAPGGEIVVETDPPGAPTHRIKIRIEGQGAVSEWFRWARVGADGMPALARRTGFTVAGTREIAGRTFVTLRRP